MKADFSLPTKAEVLMTVDEDSDVLGQENLSVGKQFPAFTRSLLSPSVGRRSIYINGGSAVF